MTDPVFSRLSGYQNWTIDVEKGWGAWETKQNRGKEEPFEFYRSMKGLYKHAVRFDLPLCRNLAGVQHRSTELRGVIDKRVLSVEKRITARPDGIILVRKFHLHDLFFIPEIVFRILDFVLPSFASLSALATAFDDSVELHLMLRWRTSSMATGKLVWGSEFETLRLKSSAPSRIGDKFCWPTGQWIWSGMWKIQICDYLRLHYLSLRGVSKLNFDVLKKRPEWISDSRFYQERFPPCLFSPSDDSHWANNKKGVSEILCKRFGEITSYGMLECTSDGHLQIPEEFAWLYPKGDAELDVWGYWIPQQLEKPDIHLDRRIFCRCRECYSYLPLNQRLMDTSLMEYVYRNLTPPTMKNKMPWCESLGQINMAGASSAGPLCWRCLTDRVEICTVPEAFGRILKAVKKDKRLRLKMRENLISPLVKEEYSISHLYPKEGQFEPLCPWSTEPFNNAPIPDPLEGAGFTWNGEHSQVHHKTKLMNGFRAAWSLICEAKRHDRENDYGYALHHHKPAEVLKDFADRDLPPPDGRQELGIDQQGWQFLLESDDIMAHEYGKKIFGIDGVTLPWVLRLISLLPYKRIAVPNITWETNTCMGRVMGDLGVGSSSWTKMAWWGNLPPKSIAHQEIRFDALSHPTQKLSRPDPESLYPMISPSPFSHGMTPCTRKQLSKLAKQRVNYKRNCSVGQRGGGAYLPENKTCYYESGRCEGMPILSQFEDMVGRKDHVHHGDELQELGDYFDITETGRTLQSEIVVSMLDGPFSGYFLPVMFKEDVDLMLKILKKTLSKYGAPYAINKIFLKFFGGGRTRKHADLTSWMSKNGPENSLRRSPFEHHRLASACIGVVAGEGGDDYDYLTSPPGLPTGLFCTMRRPHQVMALNRLALEDLDILAQSKASDAGVLSVKHWGFKNWGEAALMTSPTDYPFVEGGRIEHHKTTGTYKQDGVKTQPGKSTKDYNVVYPFRGRYYCYPSPEAVWNINGTVPTEIPRHPSKFFMEFTAVKHFKKVDPDWLLMTGRAEENRDGIRKEGQLPRPHNLRTHRSSARLRRATKLRELRIFDQVPIKSREEMIAEQKEEDRKWPEVKGSRKRKRKKETALACQEDFDISKIKASTAKKLKKKVKKMVKKMAKED